MSISPWFLVKTIVINRSYWGGVPLGNIGTQRLCSPATFFLWECWLIPGAWVSVGGCSLRRGSVIKTGRGTSVAFIVIHYLPLFDLCLSNALLLPVVILILTTSALRMVVRFQRSWEIINFSNLFPDCREMKIICCCGPQLFIFFTRLLVLHLIYISHSIFHIPRYKL